MGKGICIEVGAGLVHPECIMSTANSLIYAWNTRNYKKAYDGEAFVATCVTDAGYLVPLLVSKNPNAVAYYCDGNVPDAGGKSAIFTYGYTVTFQGETWYISKAEYGYSLSSAQMSSIYGLVHVNNITGGGGLTPQEAGLAFLNYVYSVSNVARKVKQPYTTEQNFIPRALPSGYTQIEYVESAGTQYIDTGVTVSTETRVDMGYQYVSNVDGSDGGDMIAGVRQGSAGSTRFYPASLQGGGTVRHVMGDTTLLDNYSPFVRSDVIFNDSNHDVYVNGSLLGTLSTFTTGNKTMWLFSANSEATTHWFSASRIWYCKIYEAGVLVRDFVPCKNSDGTIGMYDMVHGRFYTNSGSGTFIAGSTYKVGNVARKVKGGWVEVNNVARRFFGVSRDASEFISLGYADATGMIVNNTLTNQTLSLRVENPTGYVDTGSVWAYYILTGLNVGDVISVNYTRTIDINTNYMQTVRENMGIDGNPLGYFDQMYSNTSGTVEETKTYTSTATTFCHGIFVTRQVKQGASINIKSIKVNGEQIFPVV